MGTVTAEKSKLILNTFAWTLENNLTTREAVSWNEHDGELDDRNGLQVVEQFSPRYNVTRTENGVKDLSAGTDGTVFGGEMFEVTGTFNANMGYTDFAAISTIGEARRNRALVGAATSMAEKIDAYILGKATLASADWTGDAANADPVAEWVHAAEAKQRMIENGVQDVDLRYIFNAADETKLGDQLAKLPAPDREATNAYRRGFSGELSGIPTLFTNQLPVLTTGTRAATGAAQVNGASQNVNYSAVAKAGTVNGRRLTQELILESAGANVTIKAGEVFTLPGVFAYDNRKQAKVSPARLQQFTVVADATANASGAVTVRIFPAIIVPGTGTGDDIAINTAHATVSAAPANDAVLSFIGAASTELAPRLLIQKQAVVVNTIPLITGFSDTVYRRRLKNIPLTVRMWMHSDFGVGNHGVRFDVAMNVNIRDRTRLCRLNGS